MAGFAVVVVDDRESFANRQRFPEAKDVYADDFELVLAQLAPNHSSYVVIVTRGHRDDMRVLRWAVETPAKYIGMIGSQRKVIAIYKQLEKEGISFERLARVYAPVGIDIGAITPEEIAIAIVAEMIAIRRGVTSASHKRSLKALALLEGSELKEEAK
jgi:xanthine dehydrogenase accessory factor